MVDKNFALTVDDNIKKTNQLLQELPEPVKNRTVALNALPDKVMFRIKQIDGIILEFEKR